jgi:thioredoxin-like negative regulator of GroEL
MYAEPIMRHTFAVLSLVFVSAVGQAQAQEKAESPRVRPTIYSETADAHTEIKRALAQAAKQHKRVILDFGGNWCGDCIALNSLFHKEPNASLLKGGFILVDVNIGKFDRNKDVAVKYGVPLEKGVPALAVLDGKGQVLYSQKNGEFESMRKMDPSSVTEFLTKWKG